MGNTLKYHTDFGKNNFFSSELQVLFEFKVEHQGQNLSIRIEI
jgi:hypothetical protein